MLFLLITSISVCYSFDRLSSSSKTVIGGNSSLSNRSIRVSVGFFEPVDLDFKLVQAVEEVSTMLTMMQQNTDLVA